MAKDVSEKILAIRAKAGNENKECPTCTRAPGDPFRRHDETGKIIMGCIDAIHTGKLPVPSETNFWHMRKEALDIRRRELKRLKQIK